MTQSIAGKFGGLAPHSGLACDRQIKIRQYFILAYKIRMAIPYRTTKFKSTNIFTMATQPPNLIPANISGYTVVYIVSCKCIIVMDATYYEY